MSKRAAEPKNEVTLRRGGGDRTPITNLLSAFGAVKETNISAMLGYLIHLRPDIALNLFSIEGPVEAVFLEPRSKEGCDRYDIVVRNLRGDNVIEVKIGGHDPVQINRYLKANKNTFAIGGRLRAHLHRRSFLKRFLEWEQVAICLRKAKRTGRKADHFFNRLVDDFLLHLQENNMIQADRGDVYVRDLSGDSVAVYFHYWIYKCQPKFFEGARNARYFAPYLTGSNLRGERQSLFRSLGIGISFISEVQSVELLPERDIKKLLQANKFSRTDIKSIFEKFSWKENSGREHTIMILGPPMRLFQNPVTKIAIWGRATGAMPATSFNFGDLVAAANGLFPLEKKKKQKRK